MKITVFWNVMQRTPAEVYGGFEGMCCRTFMKITVFWNVMQRTPAEVYGGFKGMCCPIFYPKTSLNFYQTIRSHSRRQKSSVTTGITSNLT
jgi:hypothetical protein